MKRFVIIFVSVSLLAGLGFWWFSPGEVVKRRTEKLLEVLTFDATSGRGARQMGVYSLNALLANEVKLSSKSITEANGTFERADLESAYSWLGAQAKQTFFKLEGFDSIDVEGDQATVIFRLEALVELQNYRPADGKYRVIFKWKAIENSWRLQDAEWN